jgi:hypothetical protein
MFVWAFFIMLFSDPKSVKGFYKEARANFGRFKQAMIKGVEGCNGDFYKYEEIFNKEIFPE